MSLSRPKQNLSFLVLSTLSALLLHAVFLLTRAVSAHARAADVEIWSVDGRAARSTVGQSIDAVPTAAPTRDRPGPQ